jgi:hypothetical protein
MLGLLSRFRDGFSQLILTRHCKPGGYFELHDLFTNISSDHGPIAEDSAVREWCHLMREGIVKMQRTLELDFEKLAELMREVGFTYVTLQPFKIPSGRWPADPKLKEAGALQQVAMLEGIEALSLAIFTRCLDWQPGEVQVFLAKVRREFTMRKTYTYWPWYVAVEQVSIISLC